MNQTDSFAAQRRTYRRQVLESFGASGAETGELLAYTESAFSPLEWQDVHCPLPDEPFVAVWREYASECLEAKSILPLRKYLVQLNFPVEDGISGTVDYKAATGAGMEPEDGPGLRLLMPHRCRVLIHPTPAGSIPLLVASERNDFVSLLRALSLKNEPVPVNASVGATVISGYNNWHRIRMLKQQLGGAGLNEALRNRDLYQDRFILLSDGPYSGVAPAQIGVSAKVWREYSFIIRREHECTHYFTRRLFQTMRNNLFDELIADYVGIISAIGHYRADWGLLFLGFEDPDGARRAGRFDHYVRHPKLSSQSIAVLETLVRQAARNLEQIDAICGKNRNWPAVDPGCIVALSSLTLEELASERAVGFFRESLDEFVIQNDRLKEAICAERSI